MNKAPQRFARRLWIMWSLSVVLISACSAEPPATPPSATARPTGTATLAGTAIPTGTSTPTGTAIPATTPTSPAAAAALTVITETATLASPQPLQSDTIVDRSLRGVRALTDGSRKYKTALWSPGGDWIAATPQDGPGLDAIHVQTGAAQAVVTDTYVLEPVWADARTLLVQGTTDDGDQLTRFTLGEQAITPEILLTNAPPLRAIGAGGGIVAYATAQQIHVLHQPTARQHSLPLTALVTAPAPHNEDDLTIALNPAVAELESIATVLLRIVGDQATLTPLSNPGEGLWLPRWAPDGTKLALTSIEGRMISSTRDGAERFDLGPADLPTWSPDGTRIAYAGTSAGLEFLKRDIHLVDWRGQGPRIRLTDAGEEQFFTSPSWSPNGTRIAFVEIDDGKIYVGALP